VEQIRHVLQTFGEERDCLQLLNKILVVHLVAQTLGRLENVEEHFLHAVDYSLSAFIGPTLAQELVHKYSTDF